MATMLPDLLAILEIPMDLNVLYGVAGAFISFLVPKAWNLVKAFFTGDLAKGVKVALAALDEAKVQFPAAFDDPAVKFIPFIEGIVRQAVEQKELNVDPQLVVAEVLKVFKIVGTK